MPRTTGPISSVSPAATGPSPTWPVSQRTATSPSSLVPAGTRNHFARDLGLDLRHPTAALRALADGTEIRVDLGQIGERSFVNNISFGLYADAVSRPEYRDAKTTTLLDRVPTFAGPTAAASGLRCTSAGHPGVIDPTIVVVSNNAYLPGGLTTPRTRPSLQQGVLGVLSLHARSGLDLALLALAGPGPVEGNATWIAPHAMVSASTPTVTAAVDGEPVDIPAPVQIASRPAALRMRHTAASTHNPPCLSPPPDLRDRPAAGMPRRPAGPRLHTLTGPGCGSRPPIPPFRPGRACPPGPTTPSRCSVPP